MYLLYHADKEKFLNYCTDIKKDCDKMSRHRIEVLSEEIMKDQKTWEKWFLRTVEEENRKCYNLHENANYGIFYK